MRMIFAPAALAACVLAAPASAAVFDFSYSGADFSASGQLFTSGMADAEGFFTVTSLTGTRNGETLTLLAPGGFPTIEPNDNRVSANAPFLSFNGLSFAGGGMNYNIFSIGGGRFNECRGSDASCTEQVDVARFTLTTVVAPAAVPEPASWAMMIGGFGLVGSAMRRRAGAVRFA